MGSDLRWEWFETPPDTAEVLDRLASLPATWGVKPVNYAAFVLPMTKDQKVKREGGDVYVPVTKLYMQVAGRVRMLADAQEANDWRVDEEGELLSLDPVVYRVSIVIARKDAAMLGNRYGIAKAAGGNTAWEKMETAARGRCLGAWGFGVLPGSGIATLDEMEIAETFGVKLMPDTKALKDQSAQEIVEQIVTLKVALAQTRGQEPEELDDGLIKWVKKAFGVTLEVDAGGFIQWSALNKGKLLLVHSNLKAQLDKERGGAE